MFNEVRAQELPQTVRRDLRALYHFYLDEERRADLARMGRVRRAIWIPLWFLKSLLLKLTPQRRLLLVIALLLALLARADFQVRSVQVSFDASPWGFLILLFVLALELKDKLLARDEIAIARQVQLALLPSRDPEVAGFALWSHTRPANDVGGDLVDYIELPGKVGVALGDVAGKGLGAALLMAKLQATLRAIAPGASSLDEIGARLNQVLCRDGLDNRFATLIYAELPAEGGSIALLNAGHNPPLVVRAGGVVLPLGPDGLPLGMFPESTYTVTRVDLEPGDLLVLYSDGLVEARNSADEEFGFERLTRLAPALREQQPADGGGRLLGEVDRFLGDVRPQDDLSIVLIRRRD
ncbi:MAG TPA: PP2C family protein-serine/threonine phosphatase [Dongiaceae bacterium]|nr:PP2C family protein-serine/threonine phosphatase [Dongiaceae bacterium]